MGQGANVRFDLGYSARERYTCAYIYIYIYTYIVSFIYIYKGSGRAQCARLWALKPGPSGFRVVGSGFKVKV